MAKLGYSRVLLMRSGGTEWDRLGRLQGATDLPIVPEGLERVQAQLHGLGGQKLDAVVSAPDEASRATAKLLARETGVRRTAHTPELAEMALGLWEGLRQDELGDRYCRAGRLFLEDPSGVMAPAGDQMDEFAARVQGGFSKIVLSHKVGGSIGIVVRPLALGVLRCVLNGADLGRFWAMLEDRPDMEWYQIPHNDPRVATSPRRPRRSVFAA